MFQKQCQLNFWQIGRNFHGHFQEHWHHLELSWTELCFLRSTDGTMVMSWTELCFLRSTDGTMVMSWNGLCFLRSTDGTMVMSRNGLCFHIQLMEKWWLRTDRKLNNACRTHTHTHTHTGLTHILAVDIPQGKWSGPHNSAWTLQWSSTRPCPSSGCPWWCCPPLLHTWHPGLPQGNHGHGTDPEMCQGMEPANCCLLTFSPHAPTTLNLTFCFYLSQKVHSASAVSKPYINHIYDTPLLLSQQFHSSSVSAKHIPS